MLTLCNGWRKVPLPASVRAHVAPDTIGYQKDVADGHLTALVSREPQGWHLSLSHRVSILDPATGKPAPGRIPSWEELKEARYALLPDAAYMAVILPPQAEYVNLHETCLHLHEMPAEHCR